MTLIPNKHHKSWDNFLTSEIIEELNNIEKKIGNDFTPEKNNILRFLKRDLNEVKCVWIGQDPYFSMYSKNKYVANGAAFWPNDLLDWNQPFSQKSLQNIIRLIYKDYNHITNYSDIKKYGEIKEEIKNGQFNILPPQEWFKSLENQGVLLLNIALTTKIGKGNAHTKIWQNFSRKLLEYISTNNPNIYWFLWGNNAKCQNIYIKSGNIFESNHPTFCSEKYKDDFLKNNCFAATFNIINWLGQ